MANNTLPLQAAHAISLEWSSEVLSEAVTTITTVCHLGSLGFQFLLNWVAPDTVTSSWSKILLSGCLLNQQEINIDPVL